MPPLRATTLRFDAQAYELIQSEAERAGLSFAQFVREAALIRAVIRSLEVYDREGYDRQRVEQMAILGEEVVRLSQADRDRLPPPEG